MGLVANAGGRRPGVVRKNQRRDRREHRDRRGRKWRFARSAFESLLCDLCALCDLCVESLSCEPRQAQAGDWPPERRHLRWFQRLPC